MFETTTASDLRRRLSFHLLQVSRRDARILITRNNRDFAALMPVRDLDIIQRTEHCQTVLELSRHSRCLNDFLTLKKTLEHKMAGASTERLPRPPAFWER